MNERQRFFSANCNISVCLKTVLVTMDPWKLTEVYYCREANTLHDIPIRLGSHGPHEFFRFVENSCVYM